MKYFNTPAPNCAQGAILTAIGDALLWPGSSVRWRTVLRWCDDHRGHEIATSILKGFGEEGGDVEEALTLGRDWEMRQEPIWLTRALAASEFGDVDQNVATRLEARRRAAMLRANRKQQEVFGR